MSSSELSSSESDIHTRDMEPPKTADNSVTEPTTSNKSQDDAMPKPVPVGCYSTQGQKLLKDINLHQTELTISKFLLIFELLIFSFG